MRSKYFVIFGILGFALALSAQNAAGPALGWTVAGDGRSVRTLYGVPGASHLGAAVSLPDDLTMLRMSPAGSTGIAVASDPAWPVVFDAASGARTALDGARLNPVSAIYSATGSAVAVRYAGDGWVQIYSGALRLIDEFAAADGPLAVSDDGSAVLMLQGASLVMRTANGTATVSDGAVTAFAFVAGSATPVYQTDAGLFIGAAQVASADGGSGAAWLASPAAGRIVWMRASGAAMVLDAAGTVLAWGDCGASNATAAVDAVRTGSLLMTPVSDGATICAADAGANPRIFFIPPAQQPAADSNQ